MTGILSRPQCVNLNIYVGHHNHVHNFSTRHVHVNIMVLVRVVVWVLSTRTAIPEDVTIPFNVLVVLLYPVVRHKILQCLISGYCVKMCLTFPLIDTCSYKMISHFVLVSVVLRSKPIAVDNIYIYIYIAAGKNADEFVYPYLHIYVS